MKNLLRYQGLYGEQQLPMASDFIHLEPLEDRSKIYSWEIEEHIHTNLVQLFFIEAGSGKLFSEGAIITLTAPCLLTVPANVLHGFQFDHQVKGEVITVSLGFFDSLLKERLGIKKQSNVLRCIEFGEKTEVFKTLYQFKEKIKGEIYHERPEKNFALKLYFELLYLELYREQIRSTSEPLRSSNRNLVYFQQFQEAIRHHAQKLLSIKDFANTLGITQTHLNRVCHQVAGKSALQVVNDFTLNEAKKYLLNTSYSISEVAYFLNFNDPAYFSRLFKKQVGVCPGEFRKG